MNINKKKLRKMLYIYISIILVLVFSSKTIYNISLPKVFAAMPQSGVLTKELTARGVITFAETMDIYATSGGQIGEIFIRKGDLINEDDVIAVFMTPNGADNNDELDFTIERINNQLAGLRLNREAIQENLRALSATAGDLYGYQNAVEDAKTTLERRQITLDALRNSIETAFDDYNYQQAITDAERSLNRIKAELQEAENALNDAIQKETSLFDDYNFQQAIIDAERSLRNCFHTQSVTAIT